MGKHLQWRLISELEDLLGTESLAELDIEEPTEESEEELAEATE